MPRRIEDSDHYTGGPITGRIYEGMENDLPGNLETQVSKQPKIVFGRDVLCPSCKGTRVDTPMSGPEAQERKRIKAKARKQGVEPPTMVRWDCSRCGGTGLGNVDD